MYLSRLILNPRSRAVQRDLSDCQALHRTVMSAFPDSPSHGDARSLLGVLHRLDIHPHAGRVTLLVQSLTSPDWSRLVPGYLLDTGGDPPNPACKCVDQPYHASLAGMALAFRLRANPTRKIDTKTGSDGRRRSGKRVELRGEEAQIEWLLRKGGEGGFELVSVRANASVPNIVAMPGGKLIGKRGSASGANTDPVTVASVLFEGVLKVTDADRFRHTLETGIGPAKAYGCGLLSVAPAGRGP